MSTARTSYWAEHAWLPTGLATGVRFEVVDGVFAGVHRRARPEAGDERLHGVVLPGFANAHSHAFHRALRGRTHGDGGNFWTWRQQMYAVTRHLTPDTYLALARAVFAEMVLAGITVVGEFHYLHHDLGGRPYADPNAMGEAVIEAARDAGLRLTLLDTCYLAGGLAGDGHVPLDEVQRRFTDGDVDRWATRVAALTPDATTRIGAAVHSVRAVPRDDLRAMAEVTRGRIVHAHVSEQPAENLATQMFYGATPTELLDEAGLLGDRFSAVHATHLSDHDIELLGRSGVDRLLLPHDRARPRGRHRPGRALADAAPAVAGLGPARGHRPVRGAAGPRDARAAVSNERGRFTPDELLTAATVDGYRSLGWQDAGLIADGAVADFVVVRTDTVNTAGSKAGQILYCATRSDVDTVVVGGRWWSESGRHRLGDVAALLGKALSDVREHQ